MFAVTSTPFVLPEYMGKFKYDEGVEKLSVKNFTTDFIDTHLLPQTSAET